MVRRSQRTSRSPRYLQLRRWVSATTKYLRELGVQITVIVPLSRTSRRRVWRARSEKHMRPVCQWSFSLKAGMARNTTRRCQNLSSESLFLAAFGSFAGCLRRHCVAAKYLIWVAASAYLHSRILSFVWAETLVLGVYQRQVGCVVQRL